MSNQIENQLNCLNWSVRVVLSSTLVFLLGQYFLFDPVPSYGDTEKETRMGHSVKLGAALSLSGASASVGKSIKRGMALAQQEINAKGLPKIIFRVEDTGSSDSGAVTAVKTLIDNRKVPVIFGPVRTSAAVAVAPLGARSETVLFSPSASAERTVEDTLQFLFSNREAARFHSKRAVEFFIENELKTIAVLAAQSDHGVSMVDHFRVGFGEKGGAIVYYGEYEENVNSIKKFVARAVEAGAEALYIVPGSSAAAGKVVSQLRLQNFNGPIVGTEAFEAPEFSAQAGNAAEGVFYTFPAFDPSQGPGERFMLKFRKRFGRAPDFFAANAYDMVNIVADGIRSCGSLSTECLRKHISKLKNYNGAGGKTTFDENGEVSKPILIKRISAGRALVVPKSANRKKPDA